MTLLPGLLDFVRLLGGSLMLGVSVGLGSRLTARAADERELRRIMIIDLELILLVVLGLAGVVVIGLAIP
jgi:NhaP-type Na+/H+ or K+/H+ antiporter